MIFRHDDVSPSTDFDKLEKIHDFLVGSFPSCEIWSCVNIFGKKNSIGAVYPDLPLRAKPTRYFYDADLLLDQKRIYSLAARKNEQIASHGLIHAVHSQMNREEQEFSILTSCNLLNTKVFVPPFNDFNGITEAVCAENGIRMTKPADGWKSIESTPFNPDHKVWFFHSWRYKTAEEFIDSVTTSRPIAEKGDGWWLKK